MFPMNKKRRWILLYMGIGAVTILLNVIAWNSTAFCDGYIRYVFPLWVNTYGRLTGLVPFSVGEIMLGLAVLLLGLAAVLWIPWGIAALMAYQKKRAQKEAVCKRTASVRLMIRRFYLFFAWTVNIVCLIMTLNCFILYHASPFSEHYFTEAGEGDYTLEELMGVRNLVVEECNRLSREMERDERGNILYDRDIGEGAIACMKALGGIYDQLDGFYPRPKPLYTSDFFLSNICADIISLFPWRPTITM